MPEVSVKQRSYLLAVALCAVAAPLTAQQSVPPPAAAVAAPPLDTSRLAGPRLRAEPRPVRPTLAASHESSRVQGRHTITVSTLALVLAVVILVLLVT
jgi:hypothetical protein